MVCEKIHSTPFAASAAVAAGTAATLRNFHQSNEFGVEKHTIRFPNFASIRSRFREKCKNCTIDQRLKVAGDRQKYAIPASMNLFTSK